MEAGPELVAIGETLALLTTPDIGRIRDMSSLRLSVGGAESNVAVGVQRLGHRTAWIGRVGHDEFGQMVIEMLRREAVDVSGVQVEAHGQTAIMLKERRTADVVRVSYYREGLAGSRLSPEDLDIPMVTGARIVHLTGITLGLSATAKAATYAAVEIAQDHGVLVSFDLNYRAALWSASEAAGAYADIVKRADMVFASEEELGLLDGGDDPLGIARRLVDDHHCELVVKRGHAGAVAVTVDGLHEEPALEVRSIDPVGAGDAFVAGYLAGVLEQLPVAERLRQGCATGAFAVTVVGDWEGLPSRDDLELLHYASGTTLR